MSFPERVDPVTGADAVSTAAWSSDTEPPFELKDADSAPAEPKPLLWTLFAGHPLPMWVLDVETLRFLDINMAACTMYGYARAEFLAMRITDLWPPEDAATLAAVAEEARQDRSGHRPQIPSRHVRKDGQIRDVEIAAHELRGGGRDAVLVLVTDITDRRRTEQQRDRLLARLHQEATEKAAILEQMGDAVLVADSDGRITLANGAAHALFDIDGSTWPDIVHGPVPWKSYDASGRLLDDNERPFLRAMSGEVVRDEFRIVTPAGRECWIWVTASPLRDEHDRVTGLVWLGRDTTEERRRRDRETQGEKLRALGQMASGVAHDLNQYLGLVAGYGDLATRALDGPSPNLAAAREALDVVVRAAMDGSESVKRLLSFARPDQDEPAEAVDMGDLLREVATVTASRWRDAGQRQDRPITLTVEVDGDTTVHGWAAPLREALINLVFNAVDALPTGGAIRLAAHQQDDRVVVVVADNGDGIPREVLRRVFEPFFSTKGARGTGLGLAIVYGVVERHQGIVSISSPPGRGTTVTLMLPALDAGPPRVPRRVEAPATGGLRILAVDDEPSITRMVGMMLAPYGHDVTVAASAEEALTMLDGALVPYDLIVSDLGLGEGMSGWELLERTRVLAPETRFILSTGWGAQIDPAEVTARGGESLLPKPYRLSDLLSAIAGPS